MQPCLTWLDLHVVIIVIIVSVWNVLDMGINPNQDKKCFFANYVNSHNLPLLSLDNVVNHMAWSSYCFFFWHCIINEDINTHISFQSHTWHSLGLCVALQVTVCCWWQTVLCFSMKTLPFRCHCRYCLVYTVLCVCVAITERTGHFFIR